MSEIVRERRRMLVVSAAALFALSGAVPLVLISLAIPEAQDSELHAPPSIGLLVYPIMALAMVVVAGFAVAAIVTWRTLTGTLAALPTEAWLNLCLGLTIVVGTLGCLALQASSLLDLPANITYIVVIASFVGWWIAAVALTKLACGRRRPATVAD